jgi:hypothetical protein
MSYSIFELFDAPTGDIYPVWDYSCPPYGAGVFDVVTFTGVGATSGSARAPIVVGAPFVTSLDSNDFLYDFYFRIWVFPLRLEVRNARTNVDIPFAIWNAYPWGNTLTSITETATDGLVLDVTPPSVFREIEYRTVNLQIQPSAPLSISATYLFNFTFGSGLFYFVADRASVLSIVPDIPLNEMWAWLTDVIVATDGTEQRAGLRAVPRRSMESKLISLTEPEVKEKVKQFLFDVAGQVVIPYFQYATPITVSVLTGALIVTFDQAATDMRVGEYALILTKTSQMLCKIASFGAGTATLDSALLIDVPAGSIIAPAFASVIENRQSLRRYAVNEVSEITVDSTVATARAAFSRPGSTATITTFDGYPVLDKRPLANELVEQQFDTGYERFDYDTGTIEQITRWKFTRDEGPRQYLIHRAQQPAEMDYWRDFLDQLRGRLNPFLMPTYRKDLYMAATPADASITLLISGSDYGSNFWPNAPYKYLYLWTASGQVCVKVTGVTITTGGDSLCTLSIALPSGSGYRSISFISFLLKSRLASDEVKLEHYGLESVLTLTARTVPE